MKFVFASVAASLFAGTAFAGGYVAPVVEQPVTVAPPVIVADPSDWTGFYAGLQYGQGGIDEVSDSGPDLETDLDAWGLHGGYNRDFGKFVLGGEIDYNKVDLDIGGKADLTRLRGRAGYDMGRFLPYVTLGAAHISTDDDAGDFSETGITYGIGADFKVTDRFSLGAEYSRADFDDVDGVDGQDLEGDLVQLRGSFHF
ncbi:outer membrane protein [Paracoccus tegillarcae]|uniref:Porin family protein n=1 Tax=Paracoccus tegillarcae TaxID=1529068 RepID=A0A2K9EFT6_9RHOB|nr:porin [Paracoccus tegillarcae]AUH33830.1 porin family protein [Paracoccus tegillarcae]